MKTFLVALMAAFTFSTVTLPAVAAKKKCPYGKKWDKKRGKCVVKRGSH